MDNQAPQPTNQPNQSTHQPQSPPTTVLKDSSIHSIQKISVWVLIMSAILFALVAILAIWGVFKRGNTDIAWRAAGSLAVIALAALVINVAARIFEGKGDKF